MDFLTFTWWSGGLSRNVQTGCGIVPAEPVVSGTDTKGHRSISSPVGYDHPMARAITQRQLRNESGEIMRALDRGEAFVVTRNGVPVGELTPLRRRHFVPADTATAMFRGAPHTDLTKLRADLDNVARQGPSPRA